MTYGCCIARVLIADDDPVVCEMYRLALSRAGHEVMIANDGLAALRIASKARPDLIFLDLRMPKMEGLEVLRNLVSVNATRGIPVVMLSNYDESKLVSQSLGLGAKQYLIKAGTNPAELDRIVSFWVEG